MAFSESRSEKPKQNLVEQTLITSQNIKEKSKNSNESYARQCMCYYLNMDPQGGLSVGACAQRFFADDTADKDNDADRDTDDADHKRKDLSFFLNNDSK